MVFKALLLAFVLAFAGVAAAGEAAPAAENPALEKRVNAVADGLALQLCDFDSLHYECAPLALDQ
jgi:hypothetical protein